MLTATKDCDTRISDAKGILKKLLIIPCYSRYLFWRHKCNLLSQWENSTKWYAHF